jgi:hypothetical protein
VAFNLIKAASPLIGLVATIVIMIIVFRFLWGIKDYMSNPKGLLISARDTFIIIFTIGILSEVAIYEAVFNIGQKAGPAVIGLMNKIVNPIISSLS